MDQSTRTPEHRTFLGRRTAYRGLLPFAIVLAGFMAWDAYRADWTGFGKDAFVLVAVAFMMWLNSDLPDKHTGK